MSEDEALLVSSAHYPHGGEAWIVTIPTNSITPTENSALSVVGVQGIWWRLEKLHNPFTHAFPETNGERWNATCKWLFVVVETPPTWKELTHSPKESSWINYDTPTNLNMQNPAAWGMGRKNLFWFGVNSRTDGRKVMTDAKGKGAKINNITEHFQKRTDSKLRGKQSIL